MPAAMGGNSAGRVMVDSASSARSEASAGSGEGANAFGSDWGARLISALVIA